MVSSFEVKGDGRRRFARRATAGMAILLMLPFAGLACGEDDTEVARDPVRPSDASPTALAEVSGSTEVAQVAIVDGAFSVEEVVAQQLEPTIIKIDNKDATPYRLRIDGLVTPTEIAPNAVTGVEFTTPSAGRFDGDLLAAEGDATLDELVITVIAPGATHP
ncbi:MAG TPA: cupredoxin domain-containing protein [Thermomicrobiales bacterium]|nr:cupredoxin domain-containing protein [Thermomicrobiales bacterium]